MHGPINLRFFSEFGCQTLSLSLCIIPSEWEKWFIHNIEKLLQCKHNGLWKRWGSKYQSTRHRNVSFLSESWPLCLYVLPNKHGTVTLIKFMIYWNNVFIDFPNNSVVCNVWSSILVQTVCFSPACVLQICASRARFIARLLRIQVFRCCWVCVKCAFLRFI